MVLLTRAERRLSAPSEFTEVIEKYHRAGVRFSTDVAGESGIVEDNHLGQVVSDCDRSRADNPLRSVNADPSAFCCRRIP